MHKKEGELCTVYDSDAEDEDEDLALPLPEFEGHLAKLVSSAVY
jgi:hypothetical protein